MDPGVRNHGMKADPQGYLWSKYECFLMSGSERYSPLRNLQVKLCRKFHVRDGVTNERMDGWQGKNYIPLGINAGGIKIVEIYYHIFFNTAI